MVHLDAKGWHGYVAPILDATEFCLVVVDENLETNAAALDPPSSSKSIQKSIVAIVDRAIILICEPFISEVVSFAIIPDRWWMDGLSFSLCISRLLDLGSWLLLKKRTKIDLTKMGSKKRHSNSTVDDLFDCN